MQATRLSRPLNRFTVLSVHLVASTYQPRNWPRRHVLHGKSRAPSLRSANVVGLSQTHLDVRAWIKWSISTTIAQRGFSYFDTVCLEVSLRVSYEGYKAEGFGVEALKVPVNSFGKSTRPGPVSCVSLKFKASQTRVYTKSMSLQSTPAPAHVRQRQVPAQGLSFKTFDISGRNAASPLSQPIVTPLMPVTTYYHPRSLPYPSAIDEFESAWPEDSLLRFIRDGDDRDDPMGGFPAGLYSSDEGEGSNLVWHHDSPRLIVVEPRGERSP